MFTGLVEVVGTLRRMERVGPSARLVVDAPFAADPDHPGGAAFAIGDSISVNGVCLTVTEIAGQAFSADASAETLSVTTLGKLAPGSKVNLERASKVGGRLGGHVVLGHVDGVASVSERISSGEAIRMSFSCDRSLAPYFAPKGSVAIEGVSLTINDVSDQGDAVTFDVMLIPHTLSATTLEGLRRGSQVNIEADVLARYVARQLALGRGAQMGDGVAGEGIDPHRPPHHAPGSASDSADERLRDKLQKGGFG